MIHRIVDLANQGAVDGYVARPPDGDVLGDGMGGVDYQYQLTPDPDLVPETPSATALCFPVTGDTSGALWVRQPSQVDQNSAKIAELDTKIDDEIYNVNRATAQRLDAVDKIYQRKTAYQLFGGSPVWHDSTNGCVNGGTITLVNNKLNMINPTAGGFSITINMPASPQDGDSVIIKWVQGVNVTYGTPSLLINSTTTPGAKGNTTYTYKSSLGKWG